MINNSGGTIFYGMHFYPGLAQYSEPDKEPYKIFLNEDTLRKMDSSFAGKPIFVEHVNEVDKNIDQLRKEADGWVVESFFNSVDGKHWVKMIIVSEKAERAIKNGYRLSNAYLPKLNGRSGQWNGISYQNEVIDGEYEHLAIVNNPRYEESVIMSPEEFKSYNENLEIELKRIANSKTKEKEGMLAKLKFWNKKPVENSIDIENLSVTLPKSGKEFSIYQIVNAMDEMEMKKKENEKKKNKEMDTDTDLKPEKTDLDVEGDLHNEDEQEEIEEEEKKKELKNKKMKNKEKEIDDCMKNEDEKDEKKDKEARKKALELAEHETEEIEDEDEEDKKKEMKNKKMKNSHFDSLKNAPLNAPRIENKIELSTDKIARGKSRYGSN